jgi:hypothetical protein
VDPATRVHNQRYVEGMDELKYLEIVEDNPQDLADHFPNILYFYPSEEVLDKLIRRSV